jgi:hypothetical protein
MIYISKVGSFVTAFGVIEAQISNEYICIIYLRPAGGSMITLRVTFFLVQGLRSGFFQVLLSHLLLIFGIFERGAE